MTVPLYNTTCDIYRAGRAPPQAPDVANVKCFLVSKGQSTLTTPYYTHALLVEVTTDIRDAFTNFTTPGTHDNVYVPAGATTQTQFGVVLVRTKGLTTALLVKEALLLRVGSSGAATIA
jgi:hypothetical protein